MGNARIPSSRAGAGSRARAIVLVASVLGLLVAGACSDDDGSPTNPGGGGTVFNLGPFAIGQSASFTFPNAGSFGYHCIPHRTMGMTGTVQVDGQGADSAVVQIAASGLSFTPSTAHIKPGATVRWVNASSATNHTVTSD